MRSRHVLVLAVMVLGIRVHAAEFQPIGMRAISMGGAGVASSQGPYAAYFNPAQLGRTGYRTQMVLAGGVGYREINLVRTFSDLDDIDIDETFDALADNALSGAVVSDALGEDLSIISRSLHRLARDNGFQFMPSLTFGLQAGRIGVGAYMVGEATAHGVIDETRLDLIVEQNDLYFEYDLETGTYQDSTQEAYEARSLQYAIDNHLTYVQLTGVTYTEFPLAYGHNFETRIGDLSLGGGVKLMYGTTFDLRIDVDTDDFSSEWSDAQNRDTTFGVDAGILFVPDVAQGLTVGVAAKNVNTPRFKTQDGDSLKIKPQVRAGIAYAFTHQFEFALDVDVTRNETFLPDLKSQFIGGGFSYHPRDWVSMRGGMMVNLAESDDGVILTSGLGLGTRDIQLDLAGQLSTKSTMLDDARIPRMARIHLALVCRWM